jgi:hypothetical protein
MRQILLLGLTISELSAQVFLVSSPQLDMEIPDGQLSGINHQLNIDALPGETSYEVRVRLQIEGADIDGAFNGDFYATISHGNQKAVLLNRPGRSTTQPAGYPDSGLNLTFADRAEQDIHLYGELIELDPGQPLTGLWQPDGRDINPNSVLDTSPRTALLEQFAGLNPDGQWTLFLADTEFGGNARLARWDLEFVPVPEPESATVCGALICVAWRLISRLPTKRLRNPSVAQ